MIDAAAMRLSERGCGGGAPRRAALAMAAFLGMFLVSAAPAWASVGYEPDPGTPTIALRGEAPSGVAVDQANGRIYVAMTSGNFYGEEPGYIDQLEANGTATADSPFTTGAQPVFSGVAVNPMTHSIYAAEYVVVSPFGTFGSSRVVPFSASGAMGTPFATDNADNAAAQIAVDASGRIFFPNADAGTIDVYNSSGSVQEAIACSGCPGGELAEPTSVALDSAGNLYVVDHHDGRVLEFTHAGGPYVYASEFQSGQRADAVAVDGSNGSVLVGDVSGSAGYHIVAYDPSGEQFDDFGSGLITEGFPPSEPQIAIRSSTHQVYVGDPGSDSLRVFAPATIYPPTVTTEPASPVGQIEATLISKVNANLHGTTDCHFEYANDAFFQEHGFAGSTQKPCPSLPAGSRDWTEKLDLTGLSLATTYHYRVVAKNNAGTDVGNPEEFTTLPEAPATVTTEPAASVGLARATLRGSVNSHGGTVSSCTIEYGLTQSYGKSINCPAAVGIGGGDVSESANVTGLTPATTYHYRLTATSNAGSAQGDDVEFTTLSPPPEETETGGEGSGAGGSGGTVGVEWPTAPSPSAAPSPAPKKRHACRKGFRKARVHGKRRCVKKHGRRKAHRKHRRRHRRHAH